MNHFEIQCRILKLLYNRYYSGGFNDYHKVEDIFKDAGLSYENINQVLADVLYLKNKSVIEIFQPLGNKNRSTRLRIRISVSYGLDYYQKKCIMNN